MTPYSDSTQPVATQLKSKTPVCYKVSDYTLYPEFPALTETQQSNYENDLY